MFRAAILSITLLIQASLCAFAQELSTTSAATQDWKDFLSELPHWDNNLTPEDFGFEVAWVWVNRENHYSADICWIVDHEGSSDIVLGIDDGRSRNLFTDQGMFDLEDDQWGLMPIEWEVYVDRDSDPFVVGPAGHAKTRIHLDLRAHFDYGVDSSNAPQVRIDPVSRSAIAIKSNGTKLEFTRRTPNDQEKFGHSLSEARIIVDHTNKKQQFGGVSFRSFTLDRESVIRPLHRETEFYDLLVKKKSDAEDYPRQFQQFISEHDRVEHRLWMATSRMPKLHESDSQKHLEMVEYGNRALQSNVSLETRIKHLTECAEGFIANFKSMRLYMLSKPQPTEKMRLPVDDPPIRWRIVEGRWPRTFHSLGTDLTAGIVQTLGPIDRDLVIGYLDELGRLGSPPTPYRFPLSRETLQISLPGDELFVHAIMKTRHGLAVNEAETKATLQALAASAPGSRVERAAIDTLLRLDQLSQIPPDRFEAWWQREVVLADAFLGWDTLTMLTLQPRNREMLIQRMADSPRNLCIPIRKNLRFRAEATLRTKRFDFMPEAECHRILALPEPQKPGIDSDAGKSRPFPKD